MDYELSVAHWSAGRPENEGASVQTAMLTSLSTRLIAEEWMLEPDMPTAGALFDLDWFDRLAITRPVIYARLAQKVARMVAAGRHASGSAREAYRRAFEVMRETLGTL